MFELHCATQICGDFFFSRSVMMERDRCMREISVEAMSLDQSESCELQGSDTMQKTII